MATRTGARGFVGREHELATLSALVDQLTEGGGPQQTVALVSGDAGIGKTRLVAELRDRHPDVRFLVGGCVEVAAALPFAPYVEALDGLVRDVGADRVRQLAGPGRTELARILPSLGPATAPFEGATGAARLFHAVRTLLDAVASGGPVVLVVEDLHWADPSTMDLTSFLARGRDPSPVLVLATYRTDDLHRRHPLRPVLGELSRLPWVHGVPLGPLSSPELGRLLEQLADEPVPLDRIEAIATRSEGNAFYAEELFAAGGGRRLPSGLRDLLLLRLDRMTVETARVIRTAAVAGRRVPHRLLEIVMEAGDDTLTAALREASEQGLLVPDGDGYRFRHALQREAVYDEVLPGERTRLHRAYAEALQAEPALSVSPLGVDAELAYHWQVAGEISASFEASVSAAEAADACLAPREALAHAERALALYDAVNEHGPPPSIDRLELLRRAVLSGALCGEIHRALSLSSEGVERSGHDSLVHARFLSLQARAYWTLTETDRGIEVSRAAAAALPDGDSEEAAGVLAAHARLLSLHGEDDEAVGVARAAIAMARATGSRAIEGRALNSLGLAVSVREPEEAVGRLRSALAIAEEIGNVDDVLRGYVNLSSCLASMLRLDESVAVAEEGYAALSREGLDPRAMPFLLLNWVEALARLGRLDEAETVLGQTSWADGSVVELFWRSTTGLIHAYRGRTDEAAEQLELAHQVNRDVVDPQFLDPFLELEGLVGHLRGDVEATRRSVEDRPDWGHTGWIGLRSLRVQAIAARTEADAARRARSRDDDASLADHLEMLDRYLDEARAVAAANPGDTAAVALLAMIEAEMILATSDDPAVTAESWVRSRDRARPAAAVLRPEWLHAGLRATEALTAADRRDEAKNILATTLQDAREGGFDGIVEAAEALARRARLTVEGLPVPDQNATDLTPREHEVLRLLAEGRTNRQIGETLFISPKTASVHVSRILTKLGAANRSEAGAIAHRLGL